MLSFNYPLNIDPIQMILWMQLLSLIQWKLHKAKKKKKQNSNFTYITILAKKNKKNKQLVSWESKDKIHFMHSKRENESQSIKLQMIYDTTKISSGLHRQAHILLCPIIIYSFKGL